MDSQPVWVVEAVLDDDPVDPVAAVGPERRHDHPVVQRVRPVHVAVDPVHHHPVHLRRRAREDVDCLRRAVAEVISN